MFANYHTHTPRCHHATGDEREYIENAIKAGMKILGFSDHAPQVFDGSYVSGIRMTPEEAVEYVSKLKRLAEEYKNDIEIHIGFEAEYFPDIFNRLISLCRELGAEYLIMGQHCLINEPEDIWIGRPDSSCTRLTLYVDQVIEGLSSGAFSYLAHPDMYHYTGDIQWFNTEMTRLCLAAKQFSVPLEINMLGLSDHRHYPTERFFRIAAEVGNDIVIGCDAHQPEALLNTDMQNKTREFAEKLGGDIEAAIRQLARERETKTES